MGLLPATGGHITLDGTEVTREPAHARSRRGLAYVPQGRGILPGLSALDNLRLAWTGDSNESEQEAVDRCVALFPRLAPLLDRRGGTLSGGEQQMLALARALVPNPWIVLLDEPSEGVQPSIVHEIGEILSRLKAEARLAIVIVEQNLDLVLDVATRIAVLERGRIERQFGPEEVGAGSALVDALGLGSVRMTRGCAGTGPAGAGSPVQRSARRRTNRRRSNVDRAERQTDSFRGSDPTAGNARFIDQSHSRRRSAESRGIYDQRKATRRSSR